MRSTTFTTRVLGSADVVCGATPAVSDVGRFQMDSLLSGVFGLHRKVWADSFPLLSLYLNTEADSTGPPNQGGPQASRPDVSSGS
jgi:hypothetical protein